MLTPISTVYQWRVQRRRERKWRYLLYLLLLCAAAIIASADAVTVVYPRSGTSAVSCSPNIVLASPLALDVTQAVIDIQSQTANATVRCRATAVSAQLCTLRIPELQPDVAYQAIVRGLRSTNGTPLADAVVSFHTRADVPWVESMLPEEANVLQCNDTVRIKLSCMSSALPFCPTRIVRTTEPAVVTLDPNGQTVVIAPGNQFWTNDIVGISLQLSAYTGVESDNRRWSLPVRRASKLQCRVKTNDLRQPTPELLDAVSKLSTTVVASGTLTLMAPDTVGGWRFKRWDFEAGLPAVVTRGKHEVVIDAPCEMLPPLIVLEAVYELEEGHTRGDFQGNIENFETDNEPIVGTNTYALKVRLSDNSADVGIDVRSSATISPANSFEGALPEVREVCLTSSDCWEIIGYIDENGRVDFVQPVRTLCRGWYLRAPKHEVVVMVQRRFIRLRIERYCATGLRRTDVVSQCRPHPEATIQVCVQKPAHGTRVCLPIAGSTCMDTDGQAAYEWIVQCGDDVKVAVRDFGERAVRLLGWMDEVETATPEFIELRDGLRWYGATIQMKHVVEQSGDCKNAGASLPTLVMGAMYEQGLVVNEVAFRVRIRDNAAPGRMRFEERWFDALHPYDQDIDELRDGRQVEYVPGRGTTVSMRFSLPLDLVSVNEGGIAATSYDNVHPNRVGRNTSFDVRSKLDERIVLRYDSPYRPVRCVEFAIMDPEQQPRPQATFMGEVLVEASASLASIYGKHIQQRSQFVVSRIEYPGAALRLTSHNVAEVSGQAGHLAVLQGFSATQYSNRNAEHGFRRVPACDAGNEESDECLLATNSDGDTDVGSEFAVFEPYGMQRTDQLLAVLWTIGLEQRACRGCLNQVVPTVLLRARDVLEAQFSVEKVDPLAARNAVWLETYNDLTTEYRHGIEQMDWALMGVTANRLRSPYRAVVGIVSPWTIEARLYPRVAILE